MRVCIEKPTALESKSKNKNTHLGNRHSVCATARRSYSVAALQSVPTFCDTVNMHDTCQASMVQSYLQTCADCPPVKGVDHVSEVGRHNLCKDWVIAGRSSPTDETPHHYQKATVHPCHHWSCIVWQHLQTMNTVSETESEYCLHLQTLCTCKGRTQPDHIGLNVDVCAHTTAGGESDISMGEAALIAFYLLFICLSILTLDCDVQLLHK